MLELLPRFKADTVISQFWYILPSHLLRTKAGASRDSRPSSAMQQVDELPEQQQQQEEEEQQQQQGQQPGAATAANLASASARQSGTQPQLALDSPAQPDPAAYAAAQQAAKGSAFVASTTWLGALEGYAFKMGDGGLLGYHLDAPPQTAPLHSSELVHRLSAMVHRQLHSELRKLQLQAGEEAARLSACRLEAVEAKSRACRKQLEVVHLQGQLHVASANLALQEGLRVRARAFGGCRCAVGCRGWCHTHSCQLPPDGTAGLACTPSSSICKCSREGRASIPVAFSLRRCFLFL